MKDDLELDLMIANAALREAEEAFVKLRDDYAELRQYTDKLESILKEHGIPFPEFTSL